MKRLEKIVKLYKEIDGIYYRLEKLGIFNKDDEDYLELVNELKHKLKKENELFKSLVMAYKKDYKKIYQVIDKELDNKDDYSAISKRVNDYMIMYQQHNFDKSKIERKEESIGREKLIQLDKIYMACHMNVYLVYLSLLQKEINSVTFVDLKENLLGFKYYYAFINHGIESKLINNDFNMSFTDYVDFDWDDTALKVQPNYYIDISLAVYLDTIINSITQLLSIKNVDYVDNNKRAEALSAQCMLSAGLSLLHDSDCISLKKMIDDRMNELSNDDNMVSSLIVRSIIDKELDKNKNKKIREITIKRGCGSMAK